MECHGGFRRNLRELRNNHNRDIIILLEMKMNEERAVRISRSMGFAEVFRVPATNQAGGIWVVWNPLRVKVEILANSSQAIHFNLEEGSNPMWVCSAVYASTNPRMRDY